MTKLALVVPALSGGGGVPAVARFIKDAVLSSGAFDLRVVSLCSSASDPESLRLCAPSTWTRGAVTAPGTWDGLPYDHVGAVAGELEFQRYKPRAILSNLVSDCDVILVVSGTPAWANCVLDLGKPVALQVATRARIERRRRDTHLRGLSDLWRKAMTEVTDFLDNRALLRVDSILVENRWMYEYARAINVERTVDVRYAPPGVDGDFFRPLPIRNPEKAPYILCVARLGDPRKRIDLLLEAFALLPRHLRNQTGLVLAGSSSHAKDFWRLVDGFDLRERVKLVEKPDVHSLLELYQNASAVVLPSDEEGFGVVVIEAMACGVPVISTRSGGPDGIIHDGEDGYLVALNDAPAMSAKMCRLLEDQTLNSRMGRTARATIAKHYDRRIAGKAFIDALQQMAQQAKIT